MKTNEATNAGPRTPAIGPFLTLRPRRLAVDARTRALMVSFLRSISSAADLVKTEIENGDFHAAGLPYASLESSVRSLRSAIVREHARLKKGAL
jgi:hypothetical protein